MAGVQETCAVSKPFLQVLNGYRAGCIKLQGFPEIRMLYLASRYHGGHLMILSLCFYFAMNGAVVRGRVVLLFGMILPQQGYTVYLVINFI